VLLTYNIVPTPLPPPLSLSTDGTRRCWSCPTRGTFSTTSARRSSTCRYGAVPHHFLPLDLRTFGVLLFFLSQMLPSLNPFSPTCSVHIFTITRITGSAAVRVQGRLFPCLVPPTHPFSFHCIYIHMHFAHPQAQQLFVYKGDYDTFEETRREKQRNQQRAAESADAKRAHVQVRGRAPRLVSFFCSLFIMNHCVLFFG
jgi:hypothetical protein